MTFLGAAEAVLNSVKRPLTTREVTEMALTRGLIAPTGKTPEATMSAVLYTAVRDNPEGAIRRLYTPGDTRAARDSVRWVWQMQPTMTADSTACTVRLSPFVRTHRCSPPSSWTPGPPRRGRSLSY